MKKESQNLSKPNSTHSSLPQLSPIAAAATQATGTGTLVAQPSSSQRKTHAKKPGHLGPQKDENSGPNNSVAPATSTKGVKTIVFDLS